MNAPMRRGACPSLSQPMQTGDGLLVRLRPLAGGISPEQLGHLADAAGRYGNGILEVTRRGNLQIRGLSPESAVGLAEAVEAIGIDVMSGVPIETGPLAGLDAREIADPQPLIRAIRDGIAVAGLAARLGPKVSVIVDGGGVMPMDNVAADVRVAARRDGGWVLSSGGIAKEARPLGVLTEKEAANAVLSLLGAIAAKGIRARGKDLSPEDLDKISQRSTLPPSFLPDISPTGGEIGPAVTAASVPGMLEIGGNGDDSAISPLVGEMSALRPKLRRTEGGQRRAPTFSGGLFRS